MTSINSNPNLSNIDIDQHLPSVNNFNYYTTHDFHTSEGIRSSFVDKSISALHLNIRSLAANYDSFFQMLSDLHHPFSIIGLSETKIKQGIDPFENTSLPGYHFLSQPTLSNMLGELDSLLRISFLVLKEIIFAVPKMNLSLFG